MTPTTAQQVHVKYAASSKKFPIAVLRGTPQPYFSKPCKKEAKTAWDQAL
jgi:hypothetical protein